MPSDDLPGLEDDSPVEAAPETPPHLEEEKYLPGLEGDPDGAILDNWTDADWAAWFNNETDGPYSMFELSSEDAQFVADILEATVRNEEPSEPLGEFGGLLESDDAGWRFARLSPARRERMFHLLPEMRVDDSEPPEPAKSGPSTKKVVVVAGTTLATVLMAVLIGLILRDGDSSTLGASLAPEPSEADALPSETSTDPPTDEEAPAEAEPAEVDVPASETSTDPPTEGEAPAEAEPVEPLPDPEPFFEPAPIAVISGGTPDGFFQVQVLNAPPFDAATGSYELDVTVTNRDEQVFFVDGEFVDATTYLAATFDPDGNPIPDSTATAEFFDGGIFMEFFTPGYSLPAVLVDAEIRLAPGVVTSGSTADPTPTP